MHTTTSFMHNISFGKDGRRADEPEAVIHLTPAGITQFCEKGIDEFNLNCDDETTVIKGELHIASNICRLSKEEPTLSENPVGCCIDDSSDEIKTTAISPESRPYMSSAEDVDVFLEQLTELLDREKIHRNAFSKSVIDLLPVTPLQISRKSSHHDDSSSEESSSVQLLTMENKRDSFNDQVPTRQISCRLPSSEEEENKESQQARKRQDDSINLTGQREPKVSLAAVFPDTSSGSDLSSSESPYDSFEPSHPTAGGSLSDKYEEDFQQIINDLLPQGSHDEKSNAELGQSMIPADLEEQMLTKELNNVSSCFRRAQVMLKLGTHQMNRGRVDAAIGSFARSIKEFRVLGKKDVALARAVNLLGSAFKSKSDWGRAVSCFRKAYSTRHRELGKCHVDTIDSLNHLESALLRCGDVKGARKCFWEVFWARKAIFGSAHPAVAIAAHDLANILSALRNYRDAKKFYLTAWVIYHNMALYKNHPSMVRLVQDIEHLKEMKRGVKAEV